MRAVFMTYIMLDSEVFFYLGVYGAMAFLFCILFGWCGETANFLNVDENSYTTDR